MKIGLVRHFKVKHNPPKKLLLSSAELTQWFNGYREAEIEPKAVDLRGVTWGKCFSSPLKRAIETADAIFNGEIKQVDALKELDLLPLMYKKLRLPLIAWAILIRMKSLSPNSITNEFGNQIQAFVEELLLDNDKNVLIVSHGFVMMFLQKELLKRGFRGDGFKTPSNGKVYVFEK
jgi:broad specificity phosphatase PhoE